jgi:hypothetical protein
MARPSEAAQGTHKLATPKRAEHRNDGAQTDTRLQKTSRVSVEIDPIRKVA